MNSTQPLLFEPEEPRSLLRRRSGKREARARSRFAVVVVAMHIALGAASLAEPLGDLVFADGFELQADCAWNPRPGSTMACETTVEAIQSGIMSGEVRVVFAVVTAISADRKQLWIADHPIAAIYQGVFVYRGPAALALDDSFAAGVAVQIRGYAEEYDAGTPVDTQTEIVATEEPLNLGFWQEPTPLLAIPQDLAAIAAGEPYEGVLVRVDDVEAGPTLIGNRVELSGGPGNTVQMDDFAYDYGTIVEGTDFACVKGVMELDTAFDERHLLPRSAADFALDASGCP